MDFASVSSGMVKAIDYDEIVELWTAYPSSDSRPTDGVPKWPELVGIVPLWQAVDTVVHEWAVDSRRRISAFIIRQQGAFLMDLGGILAVYEQDDFPTRGNRH